MRLRIQWAWAQLAVMPTVVEIGSGAIGLNGEHGLTAETMPAAEAWVLVAAMAFGSLRGLSQPGDSEFVQLVGVEDAMVEIVMLTP
ncbi:hypothetical protein M0R45_016642 [Rubus argutus]|uniref:Uncharacterized protein n=1 Tax=Rubus argutus TaxID=59490 RepID=A0AAW1XTY0_RUBAR